MDARDRFVAVQDVTGVAGAFPAVRQVGELVRGRRGRMFERIAGRLASEVVSEPGGRVYLVGLDDTRLTPPPRRSLAGSPAERRLYRLFSEIAPSSDGEDVALRALEAFEKSVVTDEQLTHLADMEPSGCVVDVGCDAGRTLAALPRTYALYVGVSASERALNRARAVSQELGTSAVFLQGTPHHIPLPDESADYTFSNYVLGELGAPVRKNVWSALMEMYRVARDESKLVICDMSGSLRDGYFELLNVAQVARGESPVRDIVDTWVQVFLFLARYCAIKSVSTPRIVYEFESPEDAVFKCQTIVPDVATNGRVREALLRWFDAQTRERKARPAIWSESLLVEAKLTKDKSRFEVDDELGPEN